MKTAADRHGVVRTDPYPDGQQPVSRAVVAGIAPAHAVLLSLWALAWTAIALTGYARLRHTRP